MDSAQSRFRSLFDDLNREIIGQEQLVERLLIALLADGHLLVEGPPGLAKTRAIRCLGSRLEGSFHRIQFTPDLLPADLTGTEIFRPQDGSFSFQQGPLFHNLILADEINRAPAKVQSALLEAMAERQITVGQTSYSLADPFLVMATQNPIEQEGTYPLPEAQLDRFLLHVRVDYPAAEIEQKILDLNRREARTGAASAPPTPADSFMPLRAAELKRARQDVLDLHLADNLRDYLLQLVLATRSPDKWPPLNGHISYGASPRATIALDRCARAKAWLAGRDFVIPEDIQQLAFDVLRHRLILSYEAEAKGIDQDQMINALLSCVPAP
ncbi:MAG: AAA family ATPase [Desulfuromonas sp.]|nr:MAG: AAA family ATPase [Desulfuromonas sp.]